MSTAATITIPADLLAGLDRGDETAIERAMGDLARGVAPAVLLALVKSLLRVGLPALASELLGTVGRPLLAEPSLAALASRIAGIPGERVALEEQRTNATRNLEALARVGARVPAAAIALVESSRIDVLVDAKRRLHAVVRDAATGMRLVAPLRFGLSADERERLKNGFPPTFALAGLPAPHVCDALAELHAGQPLPLKCIAFENDPLAIAAWLRCGDSRAAIESRRLECRFGDDGPDAYLASMLDRTDIPPIAACVVLRPDAPLRSAAVALVRASADRWSAEWTRLCGVARERYRGRDASYWLPRFRAALAGEAPLRIVGRVGRHTKVVRHMVRDMLAALEASGHFVTLLTEPDDDMPLVEDVAYFAREDADLAIMVNHLRTHPRPAVPVELPFVAWMQDAIAAAQTKEAGRAQGPMDLLVTQSPGYWEACFDYPRDQSIAAPNVTSWAMFGTVGDSPRRRGGPDVVYVGHGWEDVDAVNAAHAQSPTARAVLDEVSAAFRARLAAGDPPNGFERMRIVATAVRRHGVALGDLGQRLFWAAGTAFDRMFRHQALEWVARWASDRGKTFVIHGDGWHRHPRFAPFARGEIENGTPLAELCRDAGAVIHMNGTASLHHRLLDGVAAGGCVLTRRNVADELPRFHRELGSIVREQGIKSWRDAIQRSASDERVRSALEGIERCLGCAIAPTGDPRRDADLEVIRATAFWPAETLDDDGMLRQLSGEHGIMPPHGAADIAGFAASQFGTEAELHRLLDAVTGSDAARDAIRLPMREHVRRHCTMESLARAILERMTEMLERAST
ncbi:MAG: hypothetical protein U0572_05350 [Phycisphaerales bacterium]